MMTMRKTRNLKTDWAGRRTSNLAVIIFYSHKSCSLSYQLVDEVSSENLPATTLSPPLSDCLDVPALSHWVFYNCGTRTHLQSWSDCSNKTVLNYSSTYANYVTFLGVTCIL